MTHFSNIGVTEVFLEAVPTTFITSVLLVSAIFGTGDKGLTLVLIGVGWSGVLFSVGYVASVLSSAFGVSRYLNILLNFSMKSCT